MDVLEGPVGYRDSVKMFTSIEVDDRPRLLQTNALFGASDSRLVLLFVNRPKLRILRSFNFLVVELHLLTIN